MVIVIGFKVLTAPAFAVPADLKATDVVSIALGFFAIIASAAFFLKLTRAPTRFTIIVTSLRRISVSCLDESKSVSAST